MININVCVICQGRDSSLRMSDDIGESPIGSVKYLKNCHCDKRTEGVLCKHAS